MWEVIQQLISNTTRISCVSHTAVNLLLPHPGLDELKGLYIESKPCFRNLHTRSSLESHVEELGHLLLPFPKLSFCFCGLTEELTSCFGALVMFSFIPNAPKGVTEKYLISRKYLGNSLISTNNAKVHSLVMVTQSCSAFRILKKFLTRFGFTLTLCLPALTLWLT